MSLHEDKSSADFIAAAREMKWFFVKYLTRDYKYCPDFTAEWFENLFMTKAIK